ncbi:response regulator transcription factor [Actinokineospora soli]|uniref:Response regulator transcription factor n=1 Tax=Actinokineospora soli TaxID=1048753 RepID=A0ABW2TLY9_9PSEU
MGQPGRAAAARRPDCVERAYLTFYTEVDGDPERARAVRADARRFGDADLVAVATMAEARALAQRGRVAEGFALADQAMDAALGGDLHPSWAGYLFCGLIDLCHDLVDLQRMHRWTTALDSWCAAKGDAVVFGGICRLHQAQLRQARGEWARSEVDADRAGADLGGVVAAIAAEAHYVVAEARRLRGDFAGAERAYLTAHELGRDPQPGMALLRLAQGRPEVALASIRAALAAEDGGPLARVRLCAAAVEIAVAADALDVARKAAEEVCDVARRFASPGLAAMAAHAEGAVLLADGHPEEALPLLRRACARWRGLDAHHECARVRLLLAHAYALLGDDDAGARERRAAESALAGFARPPAAAPDGLTAREVDVLRLVSAGLSNREVAARLVLSEKTVARHLANIFTKLAVTSRTAAAAYAFEHGLVDSPQPSR